MSESEGSFYLTLLSNSSMSYFPNNMTSSFSTKLPKTVKLDGVWAVGVVEFQYPCTMLTVREHENVIYFEKLTRVGDDTMTSKVTYKTHIPATDYENIQQVLNAINDNSMLKGDVHFGFDNITRHVNVKVKNKNISSLTMSATLALQLGFGPSTNFVLTPGGKYPSNIYLGLPSQLFVYCDIIEPQIIGDVMALLLRVIPSDPTKYVYGSYTTQVFNPAHYLRVMRREFDTIEIDIRTSTGLRIPFQFGTSCIKLHFKRLR